VFLRPTAAKCTSTTIEPFIPQTAFFILKRIIMSSRLLYTVSFLLAFQAGFCQLAIKADTLHTLAGPAIANGVVLVRDGKIEAVGSNLAIPQGYTVYTAKVVTPGLVDARSMVGLSGAYNVPSDQDQLEKSSPLQPDLRALDAYNTEEKLVEYLRSNGVTTLHTGHGWGALVSGQTMVAKTKAGLPDEVVIKPMAMVAMTIGPAVSANFASPGTKAKQLAMLRTELLKAQAAMRAAQKDTSKASSELKQQAWQQLLRGEAKALILANTATDILSAIRLAKEFNLKLVIEGGAEAYRVIDQLKAANAEVIVHATMARAYEEQLNLTMENAALLAAAGIPVSIESGYEAYVPKTRVVLFEAAVAMANGLPYTEALKAITINPARLLGLDKRIGSIEKGKDADLVLFNGDPFEYTTRVCRVIIDGKVEAEGCK
jgi:imidazolonepropionase-like amidohydrolase